MAEFVFKDMLFKRGLTDRFAVCSAAVSTDEIGSPVHRGTVEKLKEKGVPFLPRRAVLLTKEDYDRYDYFVGMDFHNAARMRRIFGNDEKGKVSRLLEFAGIDRDVDDPWYTGDFETCYDDITRGCAALLKKTEKNFITE
jgi:protein-tyrosine phosphatase